MAVIGDQRRSAVIEQVETPGRRRGIADERGESGANDRPVEAERPAGTDGGHGVLDLETDGSVRRDRNVLERNAFFGASFHGDDFPVIEEDDAFALGSMHGHDRMVTVAGEEDDFAGARVAHARDHRVGSVEHAIAGVRLDVLHDDPLDDRQILDGADVGQAEMVSLADVGDHCHVAAVETEPFAQHTATRGLEYRRVDVGVHEYVARTLGSAAVASVDAFALDIDAIGAGHPDAVTLAAEDAGDQAHGRGLAVGAGHGDQRDTSVVAVGEHVGDDRFADGASLAVGRLQMHAQARRGVQLDDPATLLFQRTVYIHADDVDASDVQADHLRGGNGARRKVGMDVVRDIGG